jgi:uncharacterized protein (TIGR03435 family)
MKMPEAQRNEFQRQMQARLRALLADRFQLKLHMETREQPVYKLVVAKGGAKVTASTYDGSIGGRGFGIKGGGKNGETVVSGKFMPVSNLASGLSDLLQRPVIDETGLKGNFDFSFTFTPDLGPGTESDGPGLFTALQEQVGLRLESGKGPVEALVIDSVELPSEN